MNGGAPPAPPPPLAALDTRDAVGLVVGIVIGVGSSTLYAVGCVVALALPGVRARMLGA